jgi:hypothetical protein
MRAYLTPKRNVEATEVVRRVSIHGPVGIYRRDDGSHAVVAETEGEVIDIGVRDAGVSRKEGGTSPVELAPSSQGIRVWNHGSKNPITLKTNLGEQQLRSGENTVMMAGGVLELGFTTDVRITVEREQDTLSKTELEEKLGMEEDGDVVKGVSPADHAQAITVNLRKASHESVTECRKFAVELENFVTEHEVDDTDYEVVLDELERITERLENKSSGMLRDSNLDEEWVEEIELITDRVEKLYTRTS